jgi:hypothetical protein
MRRGALTAPHSSVIHRRLDQPSVESAPMKRRYDNSTASTVQPSLLGSERMEG